MTTTRNFTVYRVVSGRFLHTFELEIVAERVDDYHDEKPVVQLFGCGGGEIEFLDDGRRVRIVDYSAALANDYIAVVTNLIVADEQPEGDDR